MLIHLQVRQNIPFISGLGNHCPHECLPLHNCRCLGCNSYCFDGSLRPMTNGRHLMCWMSLDGYIFFFDGLLIMQGHPLRWMILMIFLDSLNLIMGYTYPIIYCSNQPYNVLLSAGMRQFGERKGERERGWYKVRVLAEQKVARAKEKRMG